MKRFAAAAAMGLTAALALGGAGRAAVVKPGEPEVMVGFRAAVAAFSDKHCDKAQPLLAQVIAAPGFATVLTRADQSEALAMTASCAIDAEDWKAAYAALVRATTYDESGDWVFSARFEVADILDRGEDAVQALEIAARDRPQAVSELTARRVARFHFTLRRAHEAALDRRYLAALASADYAPKEPFVDVSQLWLDHAGDLIDAGEAPRAGLALARITDPIVLVGAELDLRFAALIAQDPIGYDVRRLAERRLGRDRADQATAPNLLRGVIAVAEDLRRLGKSQAALAAVDAAVPRLEAKAGAAQAFTDKDDQLIWFWDTRSRLLRDLGRDEEAIAVLARAAAIPEHGGPNVSLVLNLSDLLLMSEKPQAALDALTPLKPGAVAPYGQMVAAANRACAYVQLGRPVDVAREMAYVRAHEWDNWQVALQVPACADDLDAVAAAFLRALADPKGRPVALIELSSFDPAPAEPSFRRKLDERLAAAGRRPEVAAAAAKVGRAQSFHLQLEEEEH